MVFYTLAIALLASPLTASAAEPTSIGYNGRLFNASGTALSGTYYFWFDLETSLAAGDAGNNIQGLNFLAVPTAPITVTNGFFSLQIPLGTSLDVFSAPIWLEMKVHTADVVGSAETLSPRVQVTKTPYAIFAQAIETNTTAPTDDTFDGRMFYDTTNDRIRYYDGDSWNFVEGVMDTATLTLDNASATAVNIGAGAVAKTVTIGNGTGATSLVLNAGTGAVNIGANAVAHTTTVGTATGAGATVLQAGTGDITIESQDDINIGANAIAQDIVIGNATGATSITINSGTGALNLGSNAIAHTTTVGTTTGTASTTLQSGTGGVNITSATTGNIFIASGSTGNITLDSGSTGQVNLGTGASSKQVTLGNLTGTTLLALNGGTGGLTLDSTGAISLDGTAASNFSTSVGALTLSTSAGGTSSSVILQSVDTSSDAIYLDADGGAGSGIYLDAFAAGVNTTGFITMDASEIELNGTATAASSDALDFNATLGKIDFTTTSGAIAMTAGGDTGSFTVLTNQDISLNTSGASKNINIGTTDVARSINIGTSSATVQNVTIGHTTPASTLDISSGAITDDVIDITTNGLTTGSMFDLDSSAVFTAALINIDPTGAFTGNVIDIDPTAVSSGNVLDVTYSGASTGNALDLNMGSNVAGDGLNIETGTTTSNAIEIDASNAYTGTGLVDIQADTALTGTLLRVGGNQITTGELLTLTTGDSMTDGSGHALLIDTEESTAAGDIFSIVTDAILDDTEVFRIEANGAHIIRGSSDGLDALTLTTGDIQVTDGDLDLSAGDFNVTLDAADGAAITSAASATADPLTITLTSTTDVATRNALSVVATATNQTDRTVNMINGSLTSAGTAATDIANGLRLDLASTAGATDTAIKIQNTAAWDSDIDFQFEETLNNATDDQVIFSGVGGTNNETFVIDMDSAASSGTTLSSGGTFILVNDNLSVGIDGNTTENISYAGFSFSGNDLYVDDDLGVNGDVFIDGNLSLAGTMTFDSDVDMNFGASSASSENLNIIATASTVTAGIVDLDVTAGDAAVDGINIALTQNNGATAAVDATAVEILLTGDDADGDMFGLTITGAATVNAAAGTYQAGIFIDSAEDVAGNMTDAILITSSGVNAGVTDAIDASAANIDNALNIGANDIEGTTGTITFTNFNVTSTGDATLAGGDITGTGDESIDIGEATVDTITLLVNAAAEANLSATNFNPGADGGNALGASGTEWNDLFLDTGAVVNFEAGDVTLTHAANTLAFAGVTGGFTFDDELQVNQAAAGDALDVNVTATTYTTLTGAVDVNRSGALTGVDTETILDARIAPTLTLTEPGAGTVNYFGASIDMSGLAVTAGAGTSVVAGLYLVADDDADTGTNHALFVDAGSSRFDGQVQFDDSGENIDGDGTNLTISSGADVLVAATGGNLSPSADDGAALGASGTEWADLFLNTGGVINFEAGDVTLTHSANLLTLNDALTVGLDLIVTGGDITGTGNESIDIGEATVDTITLLVNAAAEANLSATNFNPGADGGNALGASGTEWNDLFLDTGAVVNFEAGDVTLTHAANTLAFAGVTGGFTFDDELQVNQAAAGDALDVNVTATTYTTLTGAVDVNRSGALTGVDTETILDARIAPTLTLTEPGAGTVNYFGASIDMSGLAVTAGAGTSVVAGLYLVADDDADTGTNHALFVDAGSSRFDGQVQFDDSGENIDGDGTNLTISSGADVLVAATGGNLSPSADDGAALGASGTEWADLFLNTGGVINFEAGDVTLTHSSNTLALAGGDLTLTQQGTGTSPLKITSIDNATTGPLDLNVQMVSGTIIDVDYSAETQTGDLTGMSLDLSTNLTGANDLDITGVDVLTPAFTSGDSATTTTYSAYSVSAAGALVGNAGAAASILDWRGLAFTMPALTSNTGDTVKSSGVKANMTAITGTAGTVVSNAFDAVIPNSAIVTGGTMNGINIGGAGLAGVITTGPAAGTLNGLTIKGITTPGAGTENAINIGSGWDTGIAISNVPVASSSADVFDFTGTLPILDSDTFQVFDINITNANHTTANTITGIDLSIDAGDAEATETAINISANWDADISFVDTSPALAFSTNATTLSFIENGGTTLMTIADAATTATVADINGELQINIRGDNASAEALCHATNSDADVADETIDDCETAVNADYAERYPVAEGVNYGDIVVPGSTMITTNDESHGTQQIAQAVLSSTPYQGPIYGIVSNNYGDFTSAGNNIAESDNPMPVALVGRVPVKAVAENGSITIGDFVATSSTPGKAMKATQAGRVIGMALENWNGEKDTVMVQVVNTWYQPATSQASSLQGGSTALTTLSGDVSLASGTFSGSVTVAEHLYGSQDMAGRVRLASGKDKVNVTFEKPYANGSTPIITFSARSNSESSAGAWVSDESVTGFTINRPNSSAQVEFNWIAIGVTDAQVTVSDDNSEGTNVSVNDTNGPAAPAPSAPSEEPAAEEPVAEEPASEEPTAEEPATEEPAPVAEETPAPAEEPAP